MFGIAGQNQNLVITFNSLISNGYFFKSSLNLLNSASILTTDFDSVYTLTSPTDPIGYEISGATKENITTTCIGVVNAYTANNYYSPSIYQTTVTTYGIPQGWAYYQPRVVPQTSSVDSLGTTTKPTSGYGMYALSDFGSVSIDDEYKTYYIHPDSQGNRIRSATATSIPSYIPTGYNSAGYPGIGTYSYSGTMNVTFDQPFDTPPLIFITSTTVPIALHQFIKNAQGKFIGAAIVASSILTNGSNNGGTWSPQSGFGFTGVSYRRPQTGTFTYFIVSKEEPLNNSSSYGIRVFNSSSEKIFDSSYFTTSFLSINIAMPKAYMVSTTTGGSYEEENVSSTLSGPLGLCINNINAFCGCSRYISYTLTVNGSPESQGPFNFLGRYLSMTPNPSDPNLVDWQVRGTGTSSIYPELQSWQFGGNTYTRSWDFHIGNFNQAAGEVPYMSLVAAYHTL